MKSIYQIAKENNISPVTLYKRLAVRDIKPHIVRVIMLDEDQEKAILVYAKRVQKASDKGKIK